MLLMNRFPTKFATLRKHPSGSINSALKKP